MKDLPGHGQTSLYFRWAKYLDHKKLFQIGFNVYAIGKPALTHLPGR
jgi:hypothetical protein